MVLVLVLKNGVGFVSYYDVLKDFLNSDGNCASAGVSINTAALLQGTALEHSKSDPPKHSALWKAHSWTWDKMKMFCCVFLFSRLRIQKTKQRRSLTARWEIEWTCDWVSDENTCSVHFPCRTVQMKRTPSSGWLISACSVQHKHWATDSYQGSMLCLEEHHPPSYCRPCHTRTQLPVRVDAWFPLARIEGCFCRRLQPGPAVSTWQGPAVSFDPSKHGKNISLQHTAVMLANGPPVAHLREAHIFFQIPLAVQLNGSSEPV